MSLEDNKGGPIILGHEIKAKTFEEAEEEWKQFEKSLEFIRHLPLLLKKAIDEDANEKELDKE